MGCCINFPWEDMNKCLLLPIDHRIKSNLANQRALGLLYRDWMRMAPEQLKYWPWCLCSCKLESPIQLTSLSPCINSGISWDQKVICNESRVTYSWQAGTSRGGWNVRQRPGNPPHFFLLWVNVNRLDLGCLWWVVTAVLMTTTAGVPKGQHPTTLETARSMKSQSVHLKFTKV